MTIGNPPIWRWGRFRPLVMIAIAFAAIAARGAFPGSAGNVLTEKTCLAKNHNRYCWHPQWMPDGYSKFWQAVPAYNITSPVQPDDFVVHLRCGDILVHPHHKYRLPCVSCLRGIRFPAKATLIVGGHHGTHDSAARCGALAMFYTRFAERSLNSSWSVTFSTDAEHDWSRIQAARRVLSLVSSSFVFSACVGSLDKLIMFGTASGNSPWLRVCSSTSPKTWNKTMSDALTAC